MFTYSLNELRKKSEPQQNLQDIYPKLGNEFQRLSNVVKNNMFASNSTFNKTRKQPKTEQSLRAACRWSSHKSRRRNVGWTIFYLTLPSLQIPTGSLTDRATHTYCRINHTYDYQNSQRCCLEASDLRTHKIYNGHFLHQEKISYIIIIYKMISFYLSIFLVSPHTCSLKKSQR